MKTCRVPATILRELSAGLYKSAGWQPRADVYRCTEGILVKLELAGVSEHDLRITVHQNTLVVEGRRRDWSVPETQEPLSMEITYDWFRRTITLPEVVDAENLHTEYRNGMLLIQVRAKGARK